MTKEEDRGRGGERKGERGRDERRKGGKEGRCMWERKREREREEG